MTKILTALLVAATASSLVASAAPSSSSARHDHPHFPTNRPIDVLENSAENDLSLFGTVFYGIPDTLPYKAAEDDHKLFCTPLFEKITTQCPHRPAFNMWGGRYYAAGIRERWEKNSKKNGGGPSDDGGGGLSNSINTVSPVPSSFLSSSPLGGSVWWGPLSPAVSWSHVAVHQSPRYCLDDVSWLSTFGTQGDVTAPRKVRTEVPYYYYDYDDSTGNSSSSNSGSNATDADMDGEGSEGATPRTVVLEAELPPVALVFAHRQRHRHDVATLLRANPNKNILVLEVGCNKRDSKACELAVTALTLMSSHCVRCRHPTVFLHRPAESAKYPTLDSRVTISAYISGVGGAIVFPLQFSPSVVARLKQLYTSETAELRARHHHHVGNSGTSAPTGKRNTARRPFSSRERAALMTASTSSHLLLGLQPVVQALWSSFGSSLTASGIDPLQYIRPDPATAYDHLRTAYAAYGEEDDAGAGEGDVAGDGNDGETEVAHSAAAPEVKEKGPLSASDIFAEPTAADLSASASSSQDGGEDNVAVPAANATVTATSTPHSSGEALFPFLLSPTANGPSSIYAGDFPLPSVLTLEEEQEVTRKSNSVLSPTTSSYLLALLVHYNASYGYLASRASSVLYSTNGLFVPPQPLATAEGKDHISGDDAATHQPLVPPHNPEVEDIVDAAAAQQLRSIMAQLKRHNNAAAAERKSTGKGGEGSAAADDGPAAGGATLARGALSSHAPHSSAANTNGMVMGRGTGASANHIGLFAKIRRLIYVREHRPFSLVPLHIPHSTELFALIICAVLWRNRRAEAKKKALIASIKLANAAGKKNSSTIISAPAAVGSTTIAAVKKEYGEGAKGSGTLLSSSAGKATTAAAAAPPLAHPVPAAGMLDDEVRRQMYM